MLALDLDGRARFSGEAGATASALLERLRQQELDGDPLVELEVIGRHDDAHAALPEHTLDAVLAG